MYWFCDICEHHLKSVDRKLVANQDSIDKLKVESHLGEAHEMFTGIQTKLDSNQKVIEAVKLILDQLNSKPIGAELPETFAQVTAKLDANMKLNETHQNKVAKQIESLKTNIEFDSRAKNLILFGIAENSNPSGEGGENTFNAIVEFLRSCNF